MGRRRGKSPPPELFAAAFKPIDALEQTVAEATLDARFTGEQVVRWMFPDDVVNRLQAAFPITRDQDRTLHLHETIDMVSPRMSCTFTIKVKDPEIAMLVPAPGLVALQDNRGEAIMETVLAARDLHQRFEKVRTVVRWLNLYATVGAARHYCPWLTSILPGDHPFQNASGQIFREPAMSMVDIMGTMRECGAIMASALLCREPNEPKKNLVAVTFSGGRAFPRDDYTSNAFTLL